MSKILQVAWREFLATVATKGFIIGVFITPVIIGVMVLGFKYLNLDEPPRIEGEVALIDPTGQVAEGVREYLAPEAIARRRPDVREKLEKAMEQAPEQVRKLAQAVPDEAAERALQAAVGEVPILHVVQLPGHSDLEAEKERLIADAGQDGRRRLAVVVVHDEAIEKAEDVKRYGKYDLFVRAKLDDRIEDEIKDALEESIVAARFRTQDLDREEIEALTRVGHVRARAVTAEGEQETSELLAIFVPMGFMGLLLVSVFTSGQQIMITTIEEKSSRVVELLLSAVSSMQLMTGKIFGQMCVGFVILGLYGGMGIAALVAFALFGMVDPWLFFYLFVFYLIAFFIMGSLMAAIGAAVNELREAQTLMMPIMITMMIPWILWLPISRDPNSLFSVVASFVPPINTFVMLLRMTSSTPPPWWQVWLSIAVGVAAAYGALWFAAKVFRVGLLMFGKPPNFRTMIRWVRMA